MIADESIMCGTRGALLLQEAGFAVQLVIDPSSIVAQLEEFNPEAVFLEAYYDCCDGIELAALVQQCRLADPVPVVMMTTRADYRLNAETLAEHADEVVVKPIDATTLVGSARAWTRKRRGGHSPQ